MAPAAWKRKMDNLTAGAPLGHEPARETIAADPVAPLSAAELGVLLGESEQSVRSRENSGELFSIWRASRNRGQEYPTFQAWPGVVGDSLTQILAALVPLGQPHPVGGTAAYGFFTSPTDLLGGLSPLELLLGRVIGSRHVDRHAIQALQGDHPTRLELVIETARTIAASDYL